MGTVSNPSAAAFARTLTGGPRLLAWRGMVITIAALVFLSLCWNAAEVRPLVLLRPQTAAAIWGFLASLFPPDLSPEFLSTVLKAIGQTLAIAIAGTLLSILLALPMAVLSTSTLWREGILVSAEKRDGVFMLMAVVSRAVRAFMGLLRAVPDLAWALMFVAAVGLGSLAGTLALTVAYSGVLGRVYADVFQHVDPQPLEALQSTGASRLQIFLRAIWPQALPNLTAYTLYSFECCVRAASVLGFVGAGGIGYEINLSMRLFEYRQVLTLILSFMALLGLADFLSRYCRGRLRSDTDQRPANVLPLSIPKPKQQATRRILQSALVISALGTSLIVVGFTPGAFIGAGVLAHGIGFFANMLPPSLEASFVRGLGTLLLQTIAISVLGTLIGILLGGILALPATATLIFTPKDSPGRRSALDHALRWVGYGLARLTLNMLRSIPELVWVLICIIAVGIGPFAGTIAIGLHTAGVLGKLYAETMEEVPVRPLEALRANGAGPLQVLLWAIWPQAKSMLGSYTVLRWEMNLRASTILGMVGGGGLGQAIFNNVQLGFHQRVGTLVLLIYLLVMATDWIGDRLRARPVEI